MQSISRREILQYASALMAWSAAGACRAPIATTPKFAADPFTLGVASGDPLPDGVVLWTRLAPEPLAGGGMTADGRRSEVGSRARRADEADRPARHGAGAAGAGSCGARRRARTRTGPPVLLSLQRRRPRHRDRPHAHRARRRRDGRQAPVRVRLLPALGAGLLHGVRSHGPRGPRSRRPPRRLHLRRRPAARTCRARTTAPRS